MTDFEARYIRRQKRFNGIFRGSDGRFGRTIPLSAAAFFDEEKEYISEALISGLDGSQTQALEKEIAVQMNKQYAVALRSGQAALHLCLRLAAEKLYGSSSGIYTPHGLGKGGSLQDKRVFCPDLTMIESVVPVIAEGGEPVFIDSGDTDWAMDPEVLSQAFVKCPDVKIVIMNHPYGYPGRLVEIKKICSEHDAILIEDASEALGAKITVPYNGRDVSVPPAVFADYTVLDFGPDSLLGGDGGGMLLTDDAYTAKKAAYLADGARANVPWNQHEELGADYAMGDVTAAMIRGQLSHIGEIVEKKKAIYDRYRKRLDGGLAFVIPVGENAISNYRVTAMTCESSIPFAETRNDCTYTYQDVHGTAAPMEIYDVLTAFGAECAPIYKPMSMQPVFRNNGHFTLDGAWRSYADFDNDTFWLRCDRAKEYYESGIVLPSDISMTAEEQEQVIEIILACYDKVELGRAAWA